MERAKQQTAFKRIEEACQRIARGASPGTVLDTLFVALREFDDSLESILPGLFQSPSPKAGNCIVAARAALQSLQWSMHRISMLKLSQTRFRYLSNIISCLAKFIIPDNHEGHSHFEVKKTELEECLAGLDQEMQQVFPRNAPYSTALFVELHAKDVILLPPLGDEVTRYFVYFVFLCQTNCVIHSGQGAGWSHQRCCDE